MYVQNELCECICMYVCMYVCIGRTLSGSLLLSDVVVSVCTDEVCECMCMYVYGGLCQIFITQCCCCECMYR